MGQSYRIRTELGINKTINVQLDQQFDFLEILSLKIQQADVYTRSCANYGVIVGRITANNGLGIPNARVSVFIPITDVDQSNPYISSIYPYKSLADKNEDGYRYNLLPYEKSYSTHAATGTFPSRQDVLTGTTAVEIYDKYYKYTAKTNESGDYMIMGVPLGYQTVLMDVDLSDIGEFSLTPQDLIRIGRATQSQVAGGRFRMSTDLNSLPQIVTVTKSLEVSPLWGDPEVCDIAINRLDFDLRDDANIDIQPTSVFMGSLFSSPDEYRVRENCEPRDDLGNLCDLVSGPGQILAIRQTIQMDTDGNPVLEVYTLENSGNVIDQDGTWLLEMPMNLDYFVTNEFGEKILSNDPTIGIPTKAKYRFKIKWEQSNSLSEMIRRPYHLVPNVKEYGWTISSLDPITYGVNNNARKKLDSSYYFGLAWSGYTNGFTGNELTTRLNDAINCEDTFYEFNFNKVYTVSSLVDEYKKGNGRGKFIGIKEIDDNTCASNVNKFPVNDGFRNFDLLYFIFSILFLVIQLIGLNLLIVAHIALFLYNVVISVLCFLCNLCFLGICPFGFICGLIPDGQCDEVNTTVRLPMITYPDCQACDCGTDVAFNPNANLDFPTGGLSFFSSPLFYQNSLQLRFSGSPTEDINPYANTYAVAFAGFQDNAFKNDASRYKTPKSNIIRVPSVPTRFRFAESKTLPLGERINLFNERSNYFTGLNKIQVTFAKQSNINKSHFDNTLTVLSPQKYNTGDLITFVNPSNSFDTNWKYSANTINGVITGISGTSYNSSAATTVNISYATSQYVNTTVSYSLPYGSTETNYKFPQDIEYYQVITAITVSDAAKIWTSATTQSMANILESRQDISWFLSSDAGGGYALSVTDNNSLKFRDYFDDFNNQYILILQRGVDPYSPKYANEYKLGSIFGSTIDDPKFTFTAQTRLNIPIQKLTNNSITVQSFANQSEIFYQSYFFKPGIVGSTTPGLQYTGYTSSSVGYYGSIDAQNTNGTYTNVTSKGVYSKTSNGFYLSTPNSGKYDLSEDITSMGIMTVNSAGGTYGQTGSSTTIANWSDVSYYYYTKSLYPTLLSSPMLINNSVNNVMRTDRLPTSDRLDGGSWSNNPSILQQNLNFGVYVISDAGTDIVTSTYTTGAEQVTPIIDGLPNSFRVLDSFSCENMVGLGCYQGFGDNFSINTGCTTSDAVEKGCYMFLRNPLTDLFMDLDNFSEWGYRFRFFYGLCRGVLSQSFVNNWINGALYAFPIQVDTYFDQQNKPLPPEYCTDLAHFDSATNNFYFRSSPYNITTNKFVGKRTSNVGAINDVNLLFPTTIINLGFKDSFYSEIVFDPATKAYILPNINPTSYSDTSDLVNLFVISRITDEGFLSRIISFGDNSLNQLFSRPYRRIDGDLAQLMSINSEIGNISFSPQFYNSVSGAPMTILGTASDPIMAVWYSSTTENLQTKDYLTPGRINFRGNNNVGYYPYPYGIKSQVVPFYQWRLANTSTIFGNQNNTWATNESEIVQNRPYQSLDRTSLTTPNYFRNTNSSVSDLYARGYIYSVNANGSYSQTGASSNKFIVGAPFQFYFGTVKGATALDKFKTKYAIGE
jgi:hypothetical protein